MQILENTTKEDLTRADWRRIFQSMSSDQVRNARDTARRKGANIHIERGSKLTYGDYIEVAEDILRRRSADDGC